jgi:hypothetical protein
MRDIPPVYALLGRGRWAAARVTARDVSSDVAPAQLADAGRGLRALGFEGAHVTKPYKIDAVGMLDALTPSAPASSATAASIRAFWEIRAPHRRRRDSSHRQIMLLDVLRGRLEAHRALAGDQGADGPGIRRHAHAALPSQS